MELFEEGPWRWRLTLGHGAKISAQPLSRSLAMHWCHSQRRNPQECLGHLLSAKNRVDLCLNPRSLQGSTEFGILDSLPLAWRSRFGQRNFPVQAGASVLSCCLNVDEP